MKVIRGNTVGTTMKRSDLLEKDPKKSSYVHNNPFTELTDNDGVKYLRSADGKPSFVPLSEVADEIDGIKEYSRSISLLDLKILDVQNKSTFARDNMKIEFSMNPQTYVLEARLKNSNNSVISSTTVDLPLESLVVNASVSEDGAELILTLKNGETVSVGVSNIVKGLVTELLLNQTVASLEEKIADNKQQISTANNSISLIAEDVLDIWTELAKKVGKKIELEMDDESYILKVILKSSDGEGISFASVELPRFAKKSTDGLAYELSADGKYYLCTGIGTVTDTDIVIANEYKGLPVKEIAMAAFWDSNITSVYIPKNVNTINSGAFIGATSLKKVVFESESQETAFWSDCFGGNNIDIIIIPSGAYFYAQSSIGDIKNIIFKGTDTSIGEGSIYGAENIYVPWGEGEVEGAPWGSVDATIHYNSPVCDYVTMDGLVEYEYIGKIKSELDDIKSQIGDIGTALDELHNYAQALVNGGATV